MKCFRWKTWSCGNEREACEIFPSRKREEEILQLTDRDQTAHIRSPKFNKYINKAPKNRRFTRRTMCIYNVSLSCPGNSVKIQSIDENTDWRLDDNCRDYVAFYTNRSSTKPELKRFCNGTYKNKILQSNSGAFFAVMFTDQDDDIGIFDLKATCIADEATREDKENEATREDEDTITKEVGSGMERGLLPLKP